MYKGATSDDVISMMTSSHDDVLQYHYMSVGSSNVQLYSIDKFHDAIVETVTIISFMVQTVNKSDIVMHMY